MLHAIDCPATTSSNDRSDDRTSPATLAQAAERLVEDGSCRLAISTSSGAPLVEITLLGPMPLNLLRRLLDAVEGMAEAASDELLHVTPPSIRRSYRGANNWVARSRLRTRPSRLEP